MKYLKKFQKMDEYRSYVDGGIIKPNVSLVMGNNSVHYNPINCFSGIVSATSTSDYYTLFSYNNIIYEKIDTMKIDGVEVTPKYNASFSTTGEHNYYVSVKEPFTDTYKMFSGCTHITSLDFSGWDTSKVTDMSYMFATCYKLTSLDLSNWNTSNVTNMESMFWSCTSLTSLDLSNWNTSKVTDMSYMFSACSKLTSLDLSGWNCSNVTSMSSMFGFCSKLTSLDLSGWNCSKVTSMYEMFSGCYSLSNLKTNNWDISNVTNMGNMFNACYSLTSIEGIGNWDTSNVIDMRYMFYRCSGLTSLDLSNWNTSKVTKMESMFHGCSGLTSLDLSNWDISKVTIMEQMFQDCSSLTELKMGGNPSSLTYTYNMFKNITTNGTFYYNPEYDYSKIIGVLPSTWTAVPMANNIECIDLSIVGENVSCDKTNTTITYTATMTGNSTINGSVITWIETGSSISNDFGENLTSIDREIEISFTYNGMTATTTIIQDRIDLSFGIYNATSTSNSTKLINSGLTNVAKMYIDDEEITPVSAYKFSSLGAHNVNMRLKDNVTSMYAMFSGCTSLTSLDLSGWDTSKVTSVSQMFYGCSRLTSLDLSGWDTSSITNMREMFKSCYLLTSIGDVSNWDTSKVSDMYYMFGGCSSLTSLDLSNWDISKVTNMYYMFGGCSSLVELKMGGDVSNEVSTYYMFDGVNTVGKFYYNSTYDYSKIIEQLPSTWVAIPMTNNKECTELIITAENVSGRATKTNITYTATMTGNSLGDGSVVTWTENGTGISSEFEQNLSEIESREVEISFTYYGKTATTTITQGTWNEGYSFGVYSATSTSDSTRLIYSGLTNVVTMYIDDEEITPVSAYTFSSLGEHNVDMILNDGVTSMYEMFYGCSSLTSLDLSNWDTSKVTNMGYMFAYCYSLTSLDLSNWNTIKVTTMEGIFKYCSSLTSLNLSNWDTSSVANMREMFAVCESLTSLDLSNWNTSGVTNMREMFSGCTSLTSLDLSGWDTSSVTSMYGMFRGCKSLTSLDLSGWDTSSVTDMYSMFQDCSSLTEIKMGGDVSNVSNVSNMFYNIASAGTFYYNPEYDYSKIIAELPSTWTVVPMANNIECTELIITAENVSGRVTKTNITYTATCTGNSLSDGSVVTWTENGVSMSNEFGQNPSETESREVEISFTYYGKTANTTITQYIFSDGFMCYNITEPSSWITIFPNTYLIDKMYIDGNEEDEPKFTYAFDSLGNHVVDIILKSEYKSEPWFGSYDMQNMFSNCTSLTSVDISDWNTSNVSTLSSLFEDCYALTSIGDISNWDTSNVTNMSYMFKNCSGLTSLDLTNLNISNVTNMREMFQGCSSLTELKMGGDPSSITNTNSMFYRLSTSGTFYYNSAYDYSKIIAKLLGESSGWVTVPCTLVDGVLVPNN